VRSAAGLAVRQGASAWAVREGPSAWAVHDSARGRLPGLSATLRGAIRAIRDSARGRLPDGLAVRRWSADSDVRPEAGMSGRARTTSFGRDFPERRPM
jgi:hypothetical protein